MTEFSMQYCFKVRNKQLTEKHPVAYTDTRKGTEHTMERIFHYKIGPQEAGCSITAYLRARGYSRRILTHLKQTERSILRNGLAVFTNQKLAVGDILTITLIESEGSETIAPVPMPLSIVYEDADLLVIDKPADTPIHPSFDNHENTLANGLVSYYAKQGIPFTYRCINRLDRDTTGLLIVAKHMYSASLLSGMSMEHQIHREYLAIAAGRLPDSGTIDAPIARKEGSAIERCVDFQKGEKAVTHFFLESFREGYSLVRLRLETGRTHQIRVHMRHIGHPLLGDFLYCTDFPEAQKKMQRQALHSYLLHFTHPITGEELRFTSPLPPDMRWMI